MQRILVSFNDLTRSDASEEISVNKPDCNAASVLAAGVRGSGILDPLACASVGKSSN